MPADIERWRPKEPKSVQKEAERLNSTQKADIIRMSRVDAILQTALLQEGMPVGVQGSITINGSIDFKDTLIISYSPHKGFHDQWKTSATYLEVRDRMTSYGETVSQFFSHFPDSHNSNSSLKDISAQIREAVVGEPTVEELQRLPVILATDSKRKFIAETKQRIEEGQVWSIPHELEALKKNPGKEDFVIDPQLEQDIMREYHLKRRELDLAELPKVRGDVMRKMDPFVDRVIEADNFLGEEHPQIVKDYAGRAALQVLRTIQELDIKPRDFSIDGNERRDRIEHFKYWRKRALKWAKAAGIDVLPQLEVLTVQIRESTKPTPRRLLDGLQRRVFGEEQRPVAHVNINLGPEDKEIEAAYQDDITILIKTARGKIIGAQLRNDKTNKDFRVVLPLNSFPKDQVLAALAKTFPEAEVYSSMPDFLPPREGHRDVRSIVTTEDFAQTVDEDADKSIAVLDKGFAGIRIPLEKERPIGGSKVRAIWLTVRDGAMNSFDADTLSAPGGKIEDFYFPHDSLNVKIEGEFNTTGTYVLGEGWILHSMYNPLTDAEWAKMHQKFGTFLEHLLGNGNVIDDSITSISIHPGWGSPFKPEEFTRKKDYHLEKRQNEITVRDTNHLDVKSRKTVDYPNYEEGKFIFENGDNQFGIINRRGGGYLIKDLYTLVKFYQEGLHFNELSQEIERLRVM